MRIVITRRESFDLADGINAFISSLSDALIAKNHEVFLISACPSREKVFHDNFQSSRFTKMISLTDGPDPTHAHLEIVNLWKRVGLQTIKTINPDFILVNGSLPFRMPFPNCLLSHDLEPRWKYPNFIRRALKVYLYRMTDKVVATCSELKEALASEVRISPNKISVIPTCVDLAAYGNEPFEGRELAILHMGMPAYKNPLASILAFSRIQRPAKLYLTGKPSKEVTELIATLPPEVQSRIHLLGIVSAVELKRLLRTVRILVVPSDYAVPVASPTVIDGLASGTPVVGSTGISVDLIVEGKSGFRLPPHDLDAYSSKLELLLGDEQAWRKASAGALSQAANFSSHKVAASYIELAETVISQKTRILKKKRLALL